MVVVVLMLPTAVLYHLEITIEFRYFLPQNEIEQIYNCLLFGTYETPSTIIMNSNLTAKLKSFLFQGAPAIGLYLNEVFFSIERPLRSRSRRCSFKVSIKGCSATTVLSSSGARHVLNHFCVILLMTFCNINHFKSFPPPKSIV